MHVARWKAEWNVDLTKDYVERVKSEARTENGVWGVKVMMQYFDDLYGFLLDVHDDQSVGRFAIIERTFGELNYVWMTRRDKVAQAISLHKAYQNSVWTVEREARPLDDRELVFDFNEVDRIFSEIVKNEADWKAYFQSVGKQPHVIVYEDFIENYQAMVNSVLNHLGIQFLFEGKIEESRLRRQWNQLSENWKNRYLRLKQEAQQGSALNIANAPQ